MLIVCPNCTTSYQVDAPAIGARGRQVRCVRCKEVWFAAAPADVPALAEPKAAGDEAVTAFRSELGSAEPVAPPPVADAPPTAPDAAPEPATAPEESVQPATSPEESVEPATSPEGSLASGPDAETTETPAAAETKDAEPAAVALADIPIPVAEAPPLAPGAEPPDRIGAPSGEYSPADIESVARRRLPKKDGRRRGTARMPMPAVIMALAVACAGVLIWRKDVVRNIPQLASFYASIGLPVNLRGLAFDNVQVSRETHDGVPVLVVEGTIVNNVSTPVEVPRLRFALRNAAHAEVYAWTSVPSQTVLEPGAAMSFRSRLASPPDDGTDVQVRFFTRRDVVVGLH